MKDSLRKEFEWYKEVSQDCLRESLNDLDNSYTRFFKKLGGFPKFKKRGGKVSFVDQYFPSSKMCSSCGTVKQDLKLSDRDYTCDCGLEKDRGLNVAINILNEGLRLRK